MVAASGVSDFGSSFSFFASMPTMVGSVGTSFVTASGLTSLSTAVGSEGGVVGLVAPSSSPSPSASSSSTYSYSSSSPSTTAEGEEEEGG